MVRKAQPRKATVRKATDKTSVVRMPKPALTPSRRVALDALGVFGVALAVRLLYVLWGRSNDPYFGWARPGYDMSVFQAMSDMFQSGDWLMRKQGLFYFSPLYGYFCGIVYAIFGNRNFLALHLIQAAIGAWAVCLAFVTARTWLGRLGGWFAAICLTLAGPWLFYEQTLLHEGLMLFLYCVFFWGVRTGALGWRLKWARLSIGGEAIGLAALGRGNALACLIVMALWLGFDAWRGQTRQTFARAWARAGVLVLGTVLVLGAMVVRNHAVVGQWTLGMENGRVLFYLGNAIDANGTFMYSPRFLEAQKLAREQNQPDAYMRYFREDLAADPGRFIGLLGQKTYFFFRTRDLADNMNLHLGEKIILPLRLTPVRWWWLTPLGLAGLTLAWRRWREWLPVWLFAGSFAGSLILIIPIGRYRAPILLPIAIGAGFAVEWAVAYWRAGRREAVAWAGAGLIALGLLLAPWKSADEQHFIRPNDYASGIRAALDSKMPALSVKMTDLAMDDYADTEFFPIFLNSRVQTLVAAGEAKSGEALAAANTLIQSGARLSFDGALAAAKVYAAHGQTDHARDLAGQVLKADPKSEEAKRLLEKIGGE